MKGKLKVLATVLMVGVLFGFVACKPESDATVEVEKLEIACNLKEIAVGEKITLTAKVSPENATATEVTWTSSAVDVATVNENGVVTGVKAGNATITAKVGEKTATVEITVVKVSLSVSATSLEVVQKITLTSTVEPENATDKTVAYIFVEGADFASIEGNELTGKATGTVKIRAQAGAVLSDEITLEVLPAVVKVPGTTITGADYTNNYTGVFPAGRTVTLSDFYMGKYEVTQAEYKAVMKNQKITVKGTEYTLAAEPSYCTEANKAEYGVNFGTDYDNRPVENVTWYDAVYYCNARSRAEGLTEAYDITTVYTVTDGHIEDASVELVDNANGYRLPTEAEWEYAARGGDPNNEAWNYTFSGANITSGTNYDSVLNSGLDAVGWYDYNNKTGETSDIYMYQEDSADEYGTHEVGKKAANRLGIYDMSGNVWEWCYDWYNSVTSSTPATGPASGGRRVNRGGSWKDTAGWCSVSLRDYCNGPSDHYVYLGFRVVRSSF